MSDREYRKTATVMAHEATEGGVIHTLEGDHTYVAGDYICTGIEGEQWPVKRSIFESTYEPVGTAEGEQWPAPRKRGASDGEEG